MTNNYVPLLRQHWLFTAFLLTLVHVSQSQAYTVTGIAAEYHNGQVFVTWTTPSATNLQYNVYRSTSKFTTSSQLTSSTYLGFVRDSSSKNFLWSIETKKNIFYKISNSATPLAANKGVYAATCTANQSCYYAVTVTDLSTNIEDKTIVAGSNSLSSSISESLVKPLPVWQDSIETVNGEMKQHYVQFYDNLETSLYPQLNTAGSYASNFFLIRRGSATKFPLFLIFNGFGNDADKSVNLDKNRFTYGYILGVFDWLPIPNDDGTTGDNTFYSGFHKSFNMYSSVNPVPTTGVVKELTQRRIWESVKWAIAHYPIDTMKMYTKGTSSSGFGSILTSQMYAEKIACSYAVVEPPSLSTHTDEYDEMWGTTTISLPTDVLEWNTGDTLHFKEVNYIQKAVHINTERNIPPIYDIHGKNDITVPWSSTKVAWLDSLDNNRIGGAWYWDQREHNGDGKNFIDSETEPNYYRFSTNISYPAFSNCSVDQNPGDGAPANGDPYGSYNGYLDWHDDNISDKACNYIIHVYVKDMYMGGVLAPQQYSTCTTDLTFRRVQLFKPAIGASIKWKNFDEVTGAKLQTGTFTYNGGLITLTGLTVNKAGNKIKLHIDNCSAKVGDNDEDSYEFDDDILSFSKSGDGYTAHVDAESDQQAQVFMYDLLGRMVWERDASLLSGNNDIEIPKHGDGIYFVEVKGETFTQSRKLYF